MLPHLPFLLRFFFFSLSLSRCIYPYTSFSFGRDKYLSMWYVRIKKRKREEEQRNTARHGIVQWMEQIPSVFFVTQIKIYSSSASLHRSSPHFSHSVTKDKCLFCLSKGSVRMRSHFSRLTNRLCYASSFSYWFSFLFLVLSLN